MIEVLKIADNRCLLSNLCTSYDEAIKFVRNEYNQILHNSVYSIDDDKTHCSDTEAVIVKTPIYQAPIITRWIIIGAITHPSDKLFTFSIDYKYRSEDHCVIKLIAKSKNEARLLWHAYTATELDSSHASINSITVIFDPYGQDQYGHNYGLPDEYKD